MKEIPEMHYPEVVKYFKQRQKTSPLRYFYIKQNIRKALAEIGIEDYDDEKCKRLLRDVNEK